MACAIKAPEAAAVLAFPASMRKAGGARLPLLKSEPPSAMAHMADTRALAMRAFFIVFSHGINPSFLRSPAMPPSGSEGKNKCCGSSAAHGGWLHRSAGISLLLSERRAGSPDALQVSHPNL